MSILAEPRRKKRIGVDPQNVTWRRLDTVGKKLMNKMNWSEGKGLGKNEQGAAENLKLKPNFTGKGLGADHDTRSKQEWIAHHDDFANLLASLNKSKDSDIDSTSAKKKSSTSIQSRSKSLKSRVHYKFTKGKDLSLATEHQKAAIFGVQKTTTQTNSVKRESDSEDQPQMPPEKDTGSMLTISTISTTDYYKEKMAKYYKKLAGASDTRSDEAVEEVEETSEKQNKKRKQADGAKPAKKPKH